MDTLAFNGLIFSPFILFIIIAATLTLCTALVTPKLAKYINMKPSLLNLSLFICYFGLSVLLLGD